MNRHSFMAVLIGASGVADLRKGAAAAPLAWGDIARVKASAAGFVLRQT